MDTPTDQPGEPTIASVNSAVDSLRTAVHELSELIGSLAADHARTAATVEKHAHRLAVRSFLASLPECAAVCGVIWLASAHAVSGESAIAAILGVLGFRLAPGRIFGTPGGGAPPTPPTQPPASPSSS
jgi:hypothetical protein